MDSTLAAFIDRLRAVQPEYDWRPSVEMPKAFDRRLLVCEPPPGADPPGSLDEARLELRRRFTEYLEMPHPDHMLLAKTLPGVGKTTAAVEAVEAAVARRKHVAYAGPRHDFYPEVVAKSTAPWDWYEWLPRQAGDAERGKLQTCDYPAQISTWLAKGYPAMDFCSGVCGWQKVKGACIYHLQKNRVEPVKYIQHQHVTLGHPLQFDVLIGDESPLAAFLREWKIPARYVCPPGMDYEEPLTEILHLLSAVAGSSERAIAGPQLLELLGGAVEVLEACERFAIPLGAVSAQTNIHNADEAEGKPYFHLFDLAPLLKREAQAAVEGRAYPHRIIAGQGFLTLLLRHTPRALPEHVIWLDATGRPEIYQTLFGRRVEVVDARPHMQGRIFQVIDRANGKSAVTGEEGGAPQKAAQLKTLIRKIVGFNGYQQPAVIGFKKFVEGSDLPGSSGHFYAARGTNEHENADAVIVAGAPQPNVFDVVKMAKMIYFERERAFEPTWCLKEAAYQHIAADGYGRAYPVSGFWRDPDLQAVLEMVREDEIIQAAHRGRPVNHPVDIWLLTNIPIDGLPPDELLSMREIMGAPERVDVFRWELVQGLMERQDVITVADIEALGFNYDTASSYLEKIFDLPGWEKAAIKTGRRGLPPKAARRMNTRG